MGRAAIRHCPSRSLLRYCEIFANLRITFVSSSRSSYQTNVEQGDGDEEGEVEEPDEAAAGEHEDQGEDGERPPRARVRREVWAREARDLVSVLEVGEGEAGAGEVHHQHEQRH